jgi:ethanolamine ammonia-lyase large subunit
MIHRRRFLELSIAGTTLAGLNISPAAYAAGKSIEVALSGEDLPSYIQRTRGKWDDSLYRQMLGAANEFKEGDALVRVAAPNEDVRQLAR